VCWPVLIPTFHPCLTVLQYKHSFSLYKLPTCPFDVKLIKTNTSLFFRFCPKCTNVCLYPEAMPSTPMRSTHYTLPLKLYASPSTVFLLFPARCLASLFTWMSLVVTMIISLMTGAFEQPNIDQRGLWGSEMQFMGSSEHYSPHYPLDFFLLLHYQTKNSTIRVKYKVAPVHKQHTILALR